MHILAIALSFPSIVYTTLLGVALVYWMFVMIGAASVNLLGHGGDGALDGGDGADAGDAGDAGGHEAGGHDGADGGHDAGDGDGGDGDGDGDGEGAGQTGQVHGLGAMMVALKLRSAPATVVLSCLFLYSWVLSILGMQLADALPAGIAVTLAKVALLVLSPMLALLPTSLTVRPLAKLFVPSQAAENSDFVGKVCTIRTGTVTEKFGEATFEGDGVGVVLRVRVEAGEKLARGQQAVITGYDKERAEFTVTPMDIGLEDDASVDEPKKQSR